MYIKVPEGSIYIWMYSMGLAGVPLHELEHAIYEAGKDIRPKDYDNYKRGLINRNKNADENDSIVIPLRSYKTPSCKFVEVPWDGYPPHPFAGLPEIDYRWVPIGSDGKPMVKWSQGCWYKWKAEEYPGVVSLAENLKDTQMVVVDCDGDHGNGLDMKTIDFLWRYHDITHAIDKPKLISEYDGYEDSLDFRPASFHLTFKVDRVIPTMHFPDVGIDIIGNKCNSLRYWKNKVHNGLQPLTMDATIWSELQKYIVSRRKGEEYV